MITDQAELIGFSLYELLKYRATPSLFSYLAIIFWKSIVPKMTILVLDIKKQMSTNSQPFDYLVIMCQESIKKKGKKRSSFVN